MAIAQIGSATTASQASGATLAVPTPTNAGVDSLMLVWYADATSSAPGIPSGWSAIFEYNGAQGITLAWGHPASSTQIFTPSAASYSEAIGIAFTGVSGVVWDPSSPANTYATSASGFTVLINGLENSNSSTAEVTQVPGDLMLFLLQASPNVSAVASWSSPFSGGSQATVVQNTSLLGLATAVLATATSGPFSSASLTVSSGTPTYVAQLVALRQQVDLVSQSRATALPVAPSVAASAPTMVAQSTSQALLVTASPVIPASAPTQVAQSRSEGILVTPGIGPGVLVANSFSYALPITLVVIGNPTIQVAQSFTQALIINPRNGAEFAFLARNYSNAADGFLTSNVTQDDTLFPVSISGWPAAPYEIAVDRGTPIQEICLVTASTSSTLTVVRNYDQQGEYPHSVDAIVEIVASAIDWADFNLHNTDSTRDDHPSLMLSSGTRHNLATRHTAGQVIPSGPPSSSSLGDLPQAGTFSGVAMGDHQHLRTDTYSSYSSSLLLVGLITPTISGFSDSRFLTCNGGWYNQSSYPLLYSLIANTYPPVTTLYPSVSNPGTGSSPYDPAIHFAVPLVGTYVSNVYTGLLGQTWAIIAT